MKYQIKVTFWVYSEVLKKDFFNTEYHRTMDDAKLRASALNWKIVKVEPVNF